MLWILDRNDNLKCILTNEGNGCPYDEPVYFERLSGAEPFTFTMPGNVEESQHVVVGAQVMFKDLDGNYRLYTVVNIEESHKEGIVEKHVTADPAYLELLDDILEDLRPYNRTPDYALNAALSRSRWEVGIVEGSEIASTNFYYESALEAVRKVAENWEKELRFRVEFADNKITRRLVDLLYRRGADNGVRIEYGVDTDDIQRVVNMDSVVTALYGRGKGEEVGETEDGRTTYGRRITFQDVEWSVANGDPVDKPLGQRWIANPAALAKWGRENGTRHLFGVFEDRDETDTTRLLQKTWNELVSREDPQITYKMSLSVLEKLSGYDHKKVRLGDTVLVVDKEFKPELLVKARVIELKRNLNDPTVADVVLGNFIPTLAENQIKQVKINQNVEDKSGVWDRAGSINEDGTIDLEKVNGAEDLLLVADKVESIEIDVQYLVANSATIEMLDGVVGNFETLLADKVSFGDLSAVTGRIDTLYGDYGDFKLLVTNHMDATSATIDTIISNTAIAELLLSGKIVAGSSIIAEGAIGSAQISDLDVAKLTGSVIDTAKFTVQGADGRLRIQNNLLQVFDGADAPFERIALGDLHGDGSVYGMRIRGADGTTTLFDEFGLTDVGFTDGYNKLDNDSLDPKKIDINKVVTRINEGTETIISSKIYMDDDTLDVKFNQVVTAIGENVQEISTQGTQISTIQGQITNKVWQTDITQAIDDIEIGGRNFLLSSNTAELSEIETGNDDSDIEVQGDEWGRNLIGNGDFSKTYKGNPFSVDGKTYDTYPSQWVAYNGGINNPTTNYHAHIDDDTFGFNVVEFNETNGQRNWKAIHQSGLKEYLRPTQTGIFTFSVDVYATGTGTRLFGGFSYYRKSDGERGFHSGQFNIEPTEINKWVRMSAQCRLNDDVDFSKSIMFYIYGFNFTTNSILYIKNVKLEYGNTATDWTPAPEDLTQGYQYTLSQPIQPDTWYTLSTDYTGDWQGLWIDDEYVGYISEGKITFRSHDVITVDSDVVIKVLDTEAPLTWTKLEKGNKATDWTPAPEDIQGQLDAQSTYMSHFESDLTILLDSISMSVSDLEIETSGIADKAAALEGDLNSLIDDFELTKESVETRITENSASIEILSTEVSTKVEQTVYDSALGAVERSFTEVVQEIDSIRSTIQIGGGSNLIRNSVGYGGFSYWTRVSSDGSVGENLLRNSQDDIPMYPNTPTSGIVKKVPGGVRPYYEVTSDSGIDLFVAFPNDRFTSELSSVDSISFSIDVMLDEAGTVTIEGTPFVVPAETWVRIGVSKTFGSNLTKAKSMITPYSRKTYQLFDLQTKLIESIATSNGKLYYRNMKFEEGLSYTDWSSLTQDFSIEAKTSTWILSGTSKHGWVGSNGTLAQPINLLVNTDYTFSGRVLKSTPAGFVKIGLYHADTDMLVHQIARYEEPFDGSFSYQFNTGNIGRYKLVITLADASTTNPIEITDLMLAQGKNYSVWSQASGEMYTLNVKVDGNGINVLSVDGRSRTVMSPEEFAGYYNDEKIFTLNKDITEVMGLYVRGKGMYIPPVKFVQTDNSLDVVWTGREVI